MNTLKSSFLFIFFAAFSLISSTLLAQQNASDTVAVIDTVRYWDTKGSIGVNFNQVSLSNWTGGGESSISVGSIVNLNANYSKGKVIWENKLDLAYGLIKQGEGDQNDFRKTDDLLNLLTRYNYHIDEGFFLTTLVDYRTQMTLGYRYDQGVDGATIRQKKSEFMAPGFLVASFGATWKKPKVYSVTLSPFTGKFTFVLDDSLSNLGAFGIEPGDRVRGEAGAALNSNFRRTLLTNVDFQTSLNLFAGYKSFSHVDVNWEGTLFLRVNKWIKSSVAAQLVYDHDIIQKAQWRNIINVGFLIEI